MHPKRKIYIQNCTGDHCDLQGGEKKESVASAKISRIIFYFLLIGFFAVLVYVVLYAPYLKITNINITGNIELASSDLQQEMNVLLQGNFLGIIPKNNFLFISQGRMESVLMGKFKKISSVAVTKKFPDTVNVIIQERKALLVWCSNEKCFLIDENGYAYLEADFDSPELQQNNLLQVNEVGGQEITLGEKIIEPAYESYVLGIKDAIAAFGYNVTNQYSTPSRMADEINVKTNEGPEFYFSTQFSLNSAVRSLELIFKKEISDEKRNDLAYIDLRNETKIFYKLNNQQPKVEDVPVVNVEVKKDAKKK